MKLPVLSPHASLKGKRVLLRVDWNVPLTGDIGPEDSLKLQRTIPTIEDLSARGAVVIVMTHLGRPTKREAAYSTKILAHVVQTSFRLPIQFLNAALDTSVGVKDVQERLSKAEPSSIFLLENVRFLKGEETNSMSLAKALASLGDLFINDAFAACHRTHASVVGVTHYLPSYAGPSLLEEVDGLSRVLTKPKRPFVAVIGGAKLSTKMKVVTSLASIADTVLIGGAMAHPFLVAKKLEAGKSLVEAAGVPLAKKLLKNPKLLLPLDAVVTSKTVKSTEARVVPVTAVKKTEIIGDIGTETMRAWSALLKKAKTIVWNGPIGMAEKSMFSHGSLVIARTIASRSKGSCYGVVGGGDTLPIVLRSGMAEWIDHLSTGGGAMLEYLANKGTLPGLQALMKKKAPKKRL